MPAARVIGGAGPRRAAAAHGEAHPAMTFLLLDNHDSFTYNLYQALAAAVGEPPVVVANDDDAALAELLAPGPGRIEGIVVSPGPGNPAVERDFGLSRWAVGQADIPVLGICLGHQGICLAAGGRVDTAPVPMHGRLSTVVHGGDPLFDGIPARFAAMRYHSLLAYDLPRSVRVIATTTDGLPMGVRHRTRPQWGVQFHPESIATEHGGRLLANFVRLCSARRSPVRRPRARTVPARRPPVPGPPGRYRLDVREVDCDVPADAVFDALFGSEPAAFWLDTARPVPGLARFSLMGAAGGPLGEHLRYRVGGPVEVYRSDETPRERFDGDILDYLAGAVPARRVPAAGLPVEFALGYVGYLGYEVKAVTGASAAHRSATPDAQFAFADRGAVLDHRDGRMWLLALSADGVDGREWLDRAATAVRGLAPLPEPPPADPGCPPPAVRPRHSDAEYLALIAEAQRLIGLGESYEVCLTNTLDVPGRIDPWRTYRRLRTVNPAPFGALLRFPDLDLLSSSPERFLRIGTDRVVESRPIKGTCRRGTTAAEDRMLAARLAASEKERAENIMIVDLVRNDLGRTAEVGSVRVPVLCGVESYQTVHQLVSTVRARLRAGVAPAECVRQAFPGGSMTGAPKLRTMEIIDALEAGPRGVYSGVIGYFSLDGAVDLSITIRTVVVAGGAVSVGAGGAVTALSDPDAELRELWLKAEPLLRTLAAELDPAERSPGTAAV